MNIAQLELDFIAIFAADNAFTGWQLLPAQDATEIATPNAGFGATEEEIFDRLGKAGRFGLSVLVRTSSSEDRGVAASIEALHQSRVAAVRTRLTGSGYSAALAALNATARWNCVGWSAAPASETESGMRFETTVKITGTIIEL